MTYLIIDEHYDSIITDRVSDAELSAADEGNIIVINATDMLRYEGGGWEPIEFRASKAPAKRMPTVERTENYRFTVRMIDGGVHPDDRARLDKLRAKVRQENLSRYCFKKYVKLQGRLGPNNPNAWMYRRGGIYGCAQCIRLFHAASADVYVYVR